MDSFNKALMNESVNSAASHSLANSSARRKKNPNITNSIRREKMQNPKLKTVQDTSDIFEPAELDQMLNN